MKQFFKEVALSMRTGPDIADITGEIDAFIKSTGLQEGLMSASSIGSTGSITSIEYEPGVVEDLCDAIERMAPQNLAYAHERAWHDGNGHSHVQAALLGPSVSIPFRRGKLQMGTWQQVVVINHDNGPRERKVALYAVGE